eukprot:6185929-Pleurochrysis_carterae.AAC.1
MSSKSCRRGQSHTRARKMTETCAERSLRKGVGVLGFLIAEKRLGCTHVVAKGLESTKAVQIGSFASVTPTVTSLRHVREIFMQFRSIHLEQSNFELNLHPVPSFLPRDARTPDGFRVTCECVQEEQLRNCVCRRLAQAALERCMRVA